MVSEEIIKWMNLLINCLYLFRGNIGENNRSTTVLHTLVDVLCALKLAIDIIMYGSKNIYKLIKNVYITKYMNNTYLHIHIFSFTYSLFYIITEKYTNIVYVVIGNISISILILYIVLNQVISNKSSCFRGSVEENIYSKSHSINTTQSGFCFQVWMHTQLCTWTNII